MPATPDGEPRRIIVADDVPAARLPLLKSVLESAGIAFVVDNEAAATWIGVSGYGGARISVAETDAARARDLLREIPESIDAVPELAEPRDEPKLAEPAATVAPRRERAPLADALRGFALVGMVVANSTGFAFPLGETHHDAAGLDWAVIQVVTFAVAWKFFPIFALLLGWGFSEQARGLPASERPWRAHARLLWFIPLGALHVALAWQGDILMTYAVLGTIALILVRRPTSDLLLIALFGAILPYVILLGGDGFQESGWWIPRDDVSVAKAFDTYAEGSFATVARRRFVDYAHIEFENLIATGMAFAMMLAGIILGRLDWLRSPPRRAIQRIVLLTCAIALVANAVLMHVQSFGDEFRWDSMLQWAFVTFFSLTIGSLSLSVAYVSVVALLWETRLGRAALGILSPAGRCSLTTYLSHSAVLSLLYCGYGFGWFGSVSVAVATGISLVLFSAQLALAHLWLRRFPRGPVEALLQRVVSPV